MNMLFLLGNENTKGKVEHSTRKNDICVRSKFSRTQSVGLCTPGSSAGFAAQRWCDLKLVTFSPWASVSHSVPLLSFCCLPSSEDATQSKTKLNKLICVTSLSQIIRSLSSSSFVLSRAGSSLCDDSDLVLLISSHAAFSFMVGREGGKWRD